VSIQAVATFGLESPGSPIGQADVIAEFLRRSADLVEQGVHAGTRRATGTLSACKCLGRELTAALASPPLAPLSPTARGPSAGCGRRSVSRLH